jgi:hypothetical protein
MLACRWFMLLLALLACGCRKQYQVWSGHSPDRLHWVEVVEKNGRQQLLVDGNPSPLYLGIALETVTFSEDSQRLAYAAETDAGWCVVVDGAHSRLWTGIGEVVFGPGQQLAYVAYDSERWRVILESAPSPSFEAVMEGSMTFSPDGCRLAYVVGEGDGFRVVVDRELSPLYEAIGGLRFSPDAQRLAYVARKGGKQYLALNDQLLGPFLALADFTLGPKGRVGMLVRGTDGWRAVVDGRESGAFDNLGRIHFSQGGQYAYAAEREGSWFIVRNGERSSAYTSVGQLLFAGESLVSQVRLGKDYFVVVDRTRGPSLKWVGRLTICCEGVHLAYLGRPWGGTLSVFHDDTVSAVPFALDGTLVLSDDGRRWACLAVNEASGRVDVVINGEFRRPFDLEEIVTLGMLTPEASSQNHAKKVRRWIKAELDASYADEGASDTSTYR